MSLKASASREQSFGDETSLGRYSLFREAVGFIPGVWESVDCSVSVPTVRAVEFVRPMRGASRPQLVRCDDGESYVVKFRDNPQHVRVLANEMLATRLATLIHLPVPPAAFVEISRELVRHSPSFVPSDSDIAAKHQITGLHFGSRYPGPDGEALVVDFLPDRLLRRVANLQSVFSGALVFDKWTCNCDGRQVVFHRAEADAAYSAWLIDQGFCFNDGEWNFPDNPLRGLYPRRLVYEGVRGLQSFEPFLSAVENLRQSDMEECAEGIPAEWCDDASERLFGLATQLYERRRGLRQALIDAKNSAWRPFPNWE